MNIFAARLSSVVQHSVKNNILF